ncbi:MAG TPA: DNA polymerase III subunit beta [Candidatus Paceibacterota bacterium]|nr:DNA polymerase III subunit beta [Candidatus Paceibacterota bacterium]
MKFIAIRSNIKDAILVIEKATGENQNLPILKNVLIETDNDGVTFRATNLEIAVSNKVAGKVIENGKITIPLSLLSSLIGTIASDRLNFEKKGNDMQVATDNYSAVLHGLSAEDFPITPKIKGEGGHLDIKAAFLKEAIQQVTVASQFSDLRPELNSVLFDFSLESLKLASTDGFRLAEKTLPANMFTAKNLEPVRILVPLKTALELARIVKDDETIRMTMDENQVLFKTEKTELISRLIEGSFPDYSAIVPHEFQAEIAVDKNEFVNAVKLSGIFGQKNSEVKIKIHQNKKAIEMSSADQALGENVSTLAAKIKGDIPEVYFNWRYLGDPLKAIKTDDIFIGLQEEANPALIRSTSDTSFFYVLKPILKS